MRCEITVDRDGLELMIEGLVARVERALLDVPSERKKPTSGDLDYNFFELQKREDDLKELSKSINIFADFLEVWLRKVGG